jgi:hypothetical protein
MTPDLWFRIANPLAAFGWLLLAVALFVSPASPWRARLLAVAGRGLPLLLAAGYVAALAASWGSSPGGSFSSLEGVATLFSSRSVLLAGWVHYLAFDLFIGRWAVDDALACGVNRVALLPCLFLIFMFGPLGLLLYFGLRQTRPGRA